MAIIFVTDLNGYTFPMDDGTPVPADVPAPSQPTGVFTQTGDIIPYPEAPFGINNTPIVAPTPANPLTGAPAVAGNPTGTLIRTEFNDPSGVVPLPSQIIDWGAPGIGAVAPKPLTGALAGGGIGALLMLLLLSGKKLDNKTMMVLVLSGALGGAAIGQTMSNPIAVQGGIFGTVQNQTPVGSFTPPTAPASISIFGIPTGIPNPLFLIQGAKSIFGLN